jgi:hypothetical protein
MGHTDPALALRLYRHSMRRGDDEKAQLRALVDGAELALIGTESDSEGSEDDDSTPVASPENAEFAGDSEARPARFELATSRSGGERSIH